MNHHTPNRYGLPDLAIAKITLPPEVTILAPGPRGEPLWNQIQGYTIVVNRAVKIPVRSDDWVVADGNAATYDWFEWGCQNFKGRKLFSEAIHRKTERKGDYTFWMIPYIDTEIVIHHEYFRPGESVTGIAIDYAVRFGSRKINLVGVDMEGGYYDDPAAVIYSGPCYFRDSLSRLIKHFQGMGVEFRSLSPTKLDI